MGIIDRIKSFCRPGPVAHGRLPQCEPPTDLPPPPPILYGHDPNRVLGKAVEIEPGCWVVRFDLCFSYDVGAHQ